MRKCIIAFAILITGCGINAPRDDIGAQYLGAKYVLDPLGEGRGYDTDPLIRFDAFDCTTFVETVLADGDIERLNKIRYADGKIGFENRNHFIETDWLSNNSDLLENVSDKYGPIKIRHVVVDKSAWARAVHGQKIDAKPVSTDMEYISYNSLKTINNNEPLIVLFMIGETKNKIATDISVVHMGFLLSGGKILRHASTGRGVVDEDFTQYVARRKNMDNNIGVALVKIK